MAKFYPLPENNEILLEVKLSQPGLSPSPAKTAFIDTGSTISAIPETVVNDLGITLVRTDGEVSLADGSDRNDVPLVDCEIHIAGLESFVVTAAVLGPNILLGMNWFNHFDSHYIRIDGDRLLILNRLD